MGEAELADSQTRQLLRAWTLGDTPRAAKMYSSANDNNAQFAITWRTRHFLSDSIPSAFSLHPILGCTKLVTLT